MRCLFLISMLYVFFCGTAGAGDSRSNASSDWNSNYDFPSSSSVMNRLTRANLIEQKKNSGPQTEINQSSYSTTNIDSMNSFDIDGSNNSLNTTQSSEGNTSNSTIGGMINDPAGSRASASAQ
jgi:hypothetical protein